MSKLTREDIKKIANLIKIWLADNELESFRSQLSTALEPTKVLDELPLDGVKPTAQTIGTKNIIDEDIPQKGLSQEDATMNADKVMNGYIVVKRFVKNEH